MDGAQWTQENVVSKSMEEISSNECTRTITDRKVRPQKDQVVNCPRCHSTNTKFCYYNNYSLTQPRYFCKGCRRYWTAGGTLRNVPVGGGSRKNRKYNPSSTSPSLSMATSTPESSQKLPDLNPTNMTQFSSQNPKSYYQGQDLNIVFSAPQDNYHGIPQFLEFPKIENRHITNTSSSPSSFSAPLSALNFLRNEIAVRGLNSSTPNYMVPNNSVETNAFFTSGFQFQECKPNLGFSFDGMNQNGSRYLNSNGMNQSREALNESLVFPFGSVKRDSNMSGDNHDESKGHDHQSSNGYWNGMLG